MGILVDPTLAQRDWSGLVRPSLEAIAKAIVLDYSGASFKAHDAMKALRWKEESLEQRVWTLWRESLAIALPEFFVSAMLTRRPDEEELAWLLAEILSDSEAVAKSDSEGFSRVHLRTPTSFPLYPPLREKLPGWARKVAPDHLRDDERLQERLDRAFERGFRRAFADRDEHFAPLRDYFSREKGETEDRRDAWERYYRGWLSRKIEEEPLFNQPEDGSGATLGTIYQPLRCYWRVRSKPSRREMQDSRRDLPGEETEQDEVHVAWLQGALEDWLATRNPRDALRVVTGGPGSGKSSSALWFARDVALAGSVNVLVVPLQGLGVDRPIDEIVDDYVEKAGADHSMLEASPIAWLRDDPKPLLLVFDGLDEVAREDGAGLEVTKVFLRALDSRLSLANGSGGQARLMALALGRPQAAEEAARAMGGLRDEALLHVAPLCPLDEGFLSKNSQREVMIQDPVSLAGEDFRAAFYERYRPFDQYCDGDGTPEALADDGLAEMTVEPLLLYLLIVSGYAGKEWAQVKDNRNRVYERIFRDIHRRDLEKPVEHRSKMGIEKVDDFFALMECLGLAAWLGGGRSGSGEDFSTIRDRVYYTKRGGRFKGKTSAELKNVAVQTFTHRGDGEEPYYAFIHKSFGEYLTSRAIIDAGEKWLKRHEGEAGEFADDWLQLAGGGRLTSDILNFMVDEAKLRTSQMQEARNCVTALSAIASHILRHGFPAHGELITFKGSADWRRREAFQRNAEEALYALIHAWAEAGYPFEVFKEDKLEQDWPPGPIEIAWTTERAAADMLARLRDQWSNGGLVERVFRRWKLSGANLSSVDLIGANLIGADLSGANLIGANLRAANLIGANMAMANLSRANLGGADPIGANLHAANLISVNLSRANLSRANLGGANVGEANLIGAILRKADLRAANLGGANLRKADLCAAELSGANLGGANLSWALLEEADLCGANLGGANLDEADCRRLRIDSTRLQFADLSGAVNLTQDQIDKAEGNSKTKLPDGLRRPSHWSDDD